MLRRKFLFPSPHAHDSAAQANCGVNRALQSVAHDLERQRATDSLKKGLEKRPAREDLVERKPHSLLVITLKQWFVSSMFTD